MSEPLPHLPLELTSSLCSSPAPLRLAQQIWERMEELMEEQKLEVSEDTAQICQERLLELSRLLSPLLFPGGGSEEPPAWTGVGSATRAEESAPDPSHSRLVP